MPYPGYATPTSPPHNRFRDHSPTKSSPLRHTLSTLSNNSDTENSSLPSRQGTVSSNASSAYSNGNLSGYDSSADPFVSNRTPQVSAHKRERSESPVKKNAAFAKWEAREKSEQDQDQQSTPRAQQRQREMDVSPKKVRDDEWRGSIGRSESRSALQPVEHNALPKPPQHTRGKSYDENAFRPPSAGNDGTMSPPPRPPSHSHSRGYSVDSGHTSPEPTPMASPPNLASPNSLATLSRSDSMRASTRPSRPQGHARFGSVDTSSNHHTPHLDDEDLASLQKSATPQLQYLSKHASDQSSSDLLMHSPDEQVIGLTGRRKLQRSGSVRPSSTNTTKSQSNFSSAWQSTRWMDTQRKHLQAYEYLCHIGEARAWLEDVLDPQTLPPIVQLEEALRDGVTLAEVVVSLAPKLDSSSQRTLGSLRIFRSPRLQFRHSDNIALFFRLLACIQLPELFRFELVDLYEKKNIPKVIYCIHALSWLLFRKGIVDFRIGNLVGQLEFTGEELEETQKGIDRSGVKMPDFGAMKASMAVEEPPAPPEPSPEEQVMEFEEVVVDLQSQVRGALVRLRLGGHMQQLWDAELGIAELQALIRGEFAREVFEFKFAMESSTARFQAAAKGMIVRLRLRRKQRAWSTNMASVERIQSLWRGRQQRAETKILKQTLRSQRHGIKELQAAIRGALGRWRASDTWQATQDAGGEVVELQAAVRGALARMRVGGVMNALWDVEDMVVALQARMRGARVRQQAKSQRVEARRAAVDVVRLQAAARGLMGRRRQKQLHGEFEMHERAVSDVQAASRGLLARLRQARIKGALQGREASIVRLQTILRANAARHTVRVRKAELLTNSPDIARLQAVARAKLCRLRQKQLHLDLYQHEERVQDLQSFARAMLGRRNIGTQLAALEDQESNITTLQSLARAYLKRQLIFDQLVAMENAEDSVSQLQAFARAMLLRAHVSATLSELEDAEESINRIQSAARAFLVRRAFEEKRKHYRRNMEKVVKLQSFVRAKQQGQSYETLMKGANPPLPVVRRHLHLLTDSNLEFEGELEAERLRRLVVERVREVEQVEGYVEGLDVKVGLLVKNKISLDEVVKHQRHYGGSASQLLRQGSTMRNGGGGIDLKALNKQSRKKLGGYEELFFLLQTSPHYLARLFFALGSKGLAEKEGKNLERLVMTLFGFAHKSREEYFFVKLLAASAENAASHAQTLDDFLRMQNGAFHQRLFLSNVRAPTHRSYLKQLLGGMVRDGICGQEHLDLESDPLQIHLALINNEELSTGRPSHRPRELPRETVIRDPDVRQRYVEHLQDLRDLCDGFFLSLEETLHRMPYGVRFQASSQYGALCNQYPHEDPVHLAMLTGNWIWKSYLLPAFREPEMWGVIDRGLSPAHKRNLAQVTLVLGQVCSAGRLFGQDNLYLQPLNNWVTESLGRWQDALQHLFEIESPEEHFDSEQFSDLYAKTKPTVYIKLSDIFQLHSLVSENMMSIAPSRDDPIKEVLADLGTAKGNESDLGNASSNGGEITLTLKSRFKVQEDPNAESRALYMATKRLVLYIIRVQSGSNLMEILLRPITHEDDDHWIQLVQEELAEKGYSRSPRKSHHQGAFDPRASFRGGRTQSVYSEAPSNFSEDRANNPLDLEHMTYAELKSQALENIIALEAPTTPPQFRVSRHNNYQEILNALAADIRSKHRRRLERQREVDATRQTLAGLDKKACFLEEQLTSYNDYIEQCLHTLANKKSGHKGFRLPFTKQWNHERELERAGRQPKFGSYKYSARQLADKGVLMQWSAYPMEAWSQLNVVISSDEVGVFHLEASSGSMMLPGASANLLLDDLLQAQYDNKSSIDVFDEGSKGGGAKLAVNLLLHLVFKKFYRDAS